MLMNNLTGTRTGTYMYLHVHFDTNFVCYRLLFPFQSGSFRKDPNRGPSSRLHSQSVKEALYTSLVRPVINMGYKALAFRLSWRENANEEALEKVWKEIIMYRLHSNGVLKGLEGIKGFVSAITGTFNRPNGTGTCRWPSCAYPAVGYWVIFDDSIVDSRTILTSMGKNSIGAQVKEVSTSAKDLLQAMCTSLFLIVKDYNGSYVSGKLIESLECVKATLPHESLTREESVIKIVAMDDKFRALLSVLQQKLQQKKFYFSIE